MAIILQIAQRTIANIVLIATYKNAPTKQPVISIKRNIIRRLHRQFSSFSKFGSAAISAKAAVAITVVISVI